MAPGHGAPEDTLIHRAEDLGYWALTSLDALRQARWEQSTRSNTRGPAGGLARRSHQYPPDDQVHAEPLTPATSPTGRMTDEQQEIKGEKLTPLGCRKERT